MFPKLQGKESREPRGYFCSSQLTLKGMVWSPHLSVSFSFSFFFLPNSYCPPIYPLFALSLFSLEDERWEKKGGKEEDGVV